MTAVRHWARVKSARPAPKAVRTPCNDPAVNAAAPTIATAELRVGMFVHLDLGWMSHPFALSSFRITDAQQIATIRSLGLARVRWSPEHSQAELPAGAAETKPAVDTTLPATPPNAAAPAASAVRDSSARQTLRRTVVAQREAAALVERQYAEASRDWRQAADLALVEPHDAGQRLGALSHALVVKMLDARELSIRAVAIAPGDRAGHPMNVGVISLLLGRQCGLAEAEMADLGVGALAHDIGKLELPPSLHHPDEGWSRAELAHYREHVPLGVALGKRMGLAPGALLVVGQHHEHCDGSGFPQGVNANRMSLPSRLVALVNHYYNLCRPARGLTPHEALSLLFAQGQRRFDQTLLSAFVRMMGVYPPGSVVQLTDDRWAVVESVSASRPLKPKVTVHQPGVPSDETPLLDLALEPAIGIRRSLAADQLPPSVRLQLLPGTRTAWFFEATDDDADHGAPTQH